MKAKHYQAVLLSSVSFQKECDVATFLNIQEKGDFISPWGFAFFIGFNCLAKLNYLNPLGFGGGILWVLHALHFCYSDPTW